jgi:hypothetical protein
MVEVSESLYDKGKKITQESYKKTKDFTANLPEYT